MHPAPTNHRRLARMPQLTDHVGMSRAWIYDRMMRGTPRFPGPIKFGRASVWDLNAVDAYIDILASQCAEAS